MRTASWTELALLLPALCCPVAGHSAELLTVTAVNRLTIPRTGQTIELSARAVEPLGERDLLKIHVRDESGKEVLCQALDTDGDEYRTPDQVIFQADFKSGETRRFQVSAARAQEYGKGDFKAYGRFVRERFDDFAWENDRIAHRTYGRALETWKGEPLTSSAIDIWSKRVPALVIDDWYLCDHYHSDSGEGCDDYSAGTSRGCGGTGLWASGKLWVSRNFVNSRVLADGPIRVEFELTYEPFDVDGAKVSEVKRISLDAGSQLDHFESFYKVEAGGGQWAPAIGLKKVPGALKEFNAASGWLVFWEPMEKGMGMQGVGAVMDPAAIDRLAEDPLNDLLLARAGATNRLDYWAGFAWDRAGRITTAKAWTRYVDEFSQGLRSPLEVSVSVIRGKEVNGK